MSKKLLHAHMCLVEGDNCDNVGTHSWYCVTVSHCHSGQCSHIDWSPPYTVTQILFGSIYHHIQYVSEQTNVTYRYKTSNKHVNFVDSMNWDGGRQVAAAGS